MMVFLLFLFIPFLLGAQITTKTSVGSFTVSVASGVKLQPAVGLPSNTLKAVELKIEDVNDDPNFRLAVRSWVILSDTTKVFIGGNDCGPKPWGKDSTSKICYWYVEYRDVKNEIAPIPAGSSVQTETTTTKSGRIKVDYSVMTAP